MEKRNVFARLRHEIDWNDWRVIWVATAIVLSIIATLLIAWRFPGVRDVTNFAGATFASWVAGLILTVVLTLVITFAQFARPHEEVFESRARNLLRRQTGAHIDYIIPKIQEFLDPYCDEGEKEMVITEYDEVSKKFRVNQRTINRIKSYLNDMPVTFKTELAYKLGTAAPSGREPCTLTYLRVNGQEIGASEQFQDQISRPFTMIVEPYRALEIEHRMVLWICEATEANRHIPRRFTRKLVVKLHNELPSKSIKVKPNLAAWTAEEVVVGPGETRVVVSLTDMEPGKSVYDFTIEFA